MNLKMSNTENIHELSIEELHHVNGGAPAKSSSFLYDAIYPLFYLIGKSEIFTRRFWIEWDEAVS